MNEQRPLTEEQQVQIEAMQTFAEILPYRFKNGAVVDGMETNCYKCHSVISGHNIKAEVTHTNEHSVSIAGYGLCYECKLATPIEVKFDNDGGCLVKGPNGWIPGRYADDKPVGLFSRIVSFFSPRG